MPEIVLNNDEKEIHLRDYLRIINKRKGTIITFFLLTLIVVIIATFTETPLYKATTDVMIERNTSDSLTSNYRYTPYDPEFLETQHQLIQSAAVVEKVVQSLNPDKIYDTFLHEKKKKVSYIHSFSSWLYNIYLSFKEMVGIKKIVSSSTGLVSKTILPEKAVPLTKAQILENIIKAGISVEPVANSRVVRIGFVSDNPALAMKVANSVAKAYIEELVDMQMEVSQYSIEWMSKKAASQRKKLEASEQALYNYKKKHAIVTVENRLTILPQRLSELSQSLTKAETKRKELFAVYNQVKNIKRKKDLETIPAIVANPSVDSINKKILIADQKISELSKKYGYKHPKMITAVNELRTLKKKKYKVLQDAVQTIKNQYQLAVANEKSLKDLLGQTKFQAEKLEEKSIQLGMLKRKVDTNRYLYEALIKKIKEKGITEKSQTVNVWVIEKAQLPRFPAKPKKMRNILLGIILGLFGGTGCAFFLEYLDNTIKTPEDVEEKFNIPVLCTIDLFKDRGKDKNTTIVDNVLNNSSSLIAESFKGLRTSVFLSVPKNPPKSLLITSMIPGEGKSSVAACLAASVAQAGKRTLLIDADMRRSTQHRKFNLENNAGLSSMLAGVSKKEESIHLNVFDNFDLVTSGPIPPNPSELLSSAVMENMLEEFSASYDMIIIDSPPLASVTDPLILSQNVDGVIIVAWSGKTTNEILKKGIKQLAEVHAPITGVVLNRFSAKKSGYYYNYGDYYYSSES